MAPTGISPFALSLSNGISAKRWFDKLTTNGNAGR